MNAGDMVLVTLPGDVDGWYVPAGFSGLAEVVGEIGPDDFDIAWRHNGEIEPMPIEYCKVVEPGS